MMAETDKDKWRRKYLADHKKKGGVGRGRVSNCIITTSTSTCQPAYVRVWTATATTSATIITFSTI